MVSSLGHGILPGLNDIMEPLLDLASKPRALKVGTVGTWNIWLNLRWFCWGKKTVVCSLWDWVGLEWGRGWMPFQFWKTKQRRCVSLAFTVHLQLCDMWSSARGNFSRTLSRIWTREMAKFGDWRQCKDVQGSCGHLTSRNYGHSRCGLFSCFFSWSSVDSWLSGRTSPALTGGTLQIGWRNAFTFLGKILGGASIVKKCMFSFPDLYSIYVVTFHL